jgi:hypothetical protein
MFERLRPGVGLLNCKNGDFTIQPLNEQCVTQSVILNRRRRISVQVDDGIAQPELSGVHSW